MIYLIKTTCHKCGSIGEASLSFAGRHIKQICGECGAYIKFFPKNAIPDVRDIKLQIWAITDENIQWIKNAKEEIGFTGGLKGLNEKIMYWRLYKKILNDLQNASQEAKS